MSSSSLEQNLRLLLELHLEGRNLGWSLVASLDPHGSVVPLLNLLPCSTLPGLSSINLPDLVFAFDSRATLLLETLASKLVAVFSGEDTMAKPISFPYQH